MDKETLIDYLRQAIDMLEYLNENDDEDVNNLIFCIEQEIKETDNG